MGELLNVDVSEIDKSLDILHGLRKDHPGSTIIKIINPDNKIPGQIPIRSYCLSFKELPIVTNYEVK